VTPETESGGHDDRILLEGPQSRIRDLSLVVRSLRDFLTGFRGLHFVGPCVTVFGSARFQEDHPYYTLGREVGAGLARLGFTVMTGGGPGLMEAANRGAQEAGGRSVACNIRLPKEEAPNAYLDHSVQTHYFFVRKILLFKYSYAFVALPGGFGTMDELFEALTLVQTRRMQGFPIVLMGTSYWRRLLHLIHRMEREGAISPRDLSLWLTTDDLGEALAHIRTHTVDRFGLLKRRRPRASKILGETNVAAKSARPD